MYLLYRGAPVTTERALFLSHTVHRPGQDPVPVGVVMLDVKRATDRHYLDVGRRALDTLAALGVATGATDPLAFARRFAHPVNDLSLSLSHTVDQETGVGPLRVDYTHTHGGGNLPGTTDVLTNAGRTFILPPLSPTPVN